MPEGESYFYALIQKQLDDGKITKKEYDKFIDDFHKVD